MKPWKALLAISCVAFPLAAQWEPRKSSAVPRKPDGSPNLEAPAPRTREGRPDLSGIWGTNPGAYGMNIAADLAPSDIAAPAAAARKQRMETLWRDDPAQFQCLPQGPRSYFYTPLLNRILQTPEIIAVLNEDLSYRQIFLDGRPLPKDPNPTFMGYSVGHWEGDTLVVESSGFNDRTWLDLGGYPHSERLRVTERYRRKDFGHMEIAMVFTDPVYFAKPITVPIQATLAADTDLIEYVCAENEQDRKHLVGTASDDLKYAVKVAPEVLRKYVGSYEFRFPENPESPVVYNLTFVNGDLIFDTEGKDKVALIPLSETTFSVFGDRIEIGLDDRGVAKELIFIAAEGNLAGKRIR